MNRPPIRISTDRADPGYRADWFRFRVFLDGAPLPRCVTADEEAGYALIAAEGTLGQRPLLMALHGAVTVIAGPNPEQPHTVGGSQ